MSEHNCHDCGHQHDCEGMDNIIELTGENGETIQVEFLATVKLEDQEYAVMHSLEDSDDEDEGEVIIMRMEKDGEEDFLVSIEDEDELDRAFEAFKQAASDEFDFEDDEDDLDDEDSEDDDFE
ncbi:MAG: DUF1292 domain-containing protein [Ruminiclostridium sp.]|nr:DUF1292 domain-containing protein [Ruminiclostridium sp.]